MKKLILNYWKTQIEEIRKDSALRVTGVGLAFAMILTWAFWGPGRGHMVMVSGAVEPLCWSFLQNCDSFKFLNVFWAKVAYSGLLVLSLMAMVLFCFRRTVGLAVALLAIVHVLKYYILILDYRNMGNYHYMEFLAAFAFILLPRKVNTLKYLIVGFYIFAGTLKFNVEWISGAAIPEGQWMSGMMSGWMYFNGLVPIVTTYVIFLEMIFSLGLLSKRRWIFWSSFAQLAIFHLFSWEIVGFFYPGVMFSLLTVFIADRLRTPPVVDSTPTPATGFFARSGLTTASVVFLALFAMANIYPKVIPGDTALTSEGRLFALNMFDAFAQCEIMAIADLGQTSIDVSSNSDDFSKNGIRIHCDPFVHYQKMRGRCADFAGEPDFKGIRMSMVSRRFSDREYTPIMNVENICTDNIRYNAFLPNDWIIK